MSKVLSFVGLVATLAVAYGFERWITWLRAEMGVTLAVEPLLWADSLAITVLAIASILLFWQVVLRSDRDVWVAAVFIVVGFFLTFAVAIEMSLGLNSVTSSRVAAYLWPDSYVRYVAAFVGVLGVASLLVRRPPRGMPSDMPAGRPQEANVQ